MPSPTTEITLAHFSDPHLSHEPRLGWRQRISKRQLSAWSWKRSRREAQRSGILEALLADLRAQSPDHIVVTGDITNFSLVDEFAAAARWLRALGEPAAVTVVPGNHDALVAVAWHQGLGCWRPWMSGDDEHGENAPLWPFVRRRGELALIGVNSALPTPPLLATGRIGSAQRSRLEQRLAELGAEGLFRVVLLHHPIADGAVSMRKALTDRAELRAILRRTGAELVLHGHARDARFDTVAGPAGPIVCLGLPSSSAAPSRKDQGARWHRLSVDKSAGGWRLTVSVRLWDPRQSAFVSGGTYMLAIAAHRKMAALN